jgi:hypothetical protein
MGKQASFLNRQDDLGINLTFVAIIRTQFKQFKTDEEIAQKIRDGDTSIPVEGLEALLKYAPTAEEMETLRGYTGEFSMLGRAEQFSMVVRCSLVAPLCTC